MTAVLSLIVGLLIGYFVGVAVIIEEIRTNPSKVTKLSEAFDDGI